MPQLQTADPVLIGRCFECIGKEPVDDMWITHLHARYQDGVMIATIAYEVLEMSDALQLPSDDELLAYLREHPQRSLADLCQHFDLSYRRDYSYTAEASQLRNQLQRLRRARQIHASQGQRWSVVQRRTS